MTTQTLYLYQQLDDFDEFCANISNWDVDFYQLERGRFSSEHLIFGDARTIFMKAKFNRRLLQQGTAPQNLITIALLTDPMNNMHWRNLDVCGNSLLIFPPDGELHCISHADFDVLSFSLTEETLNQTCASFELPDFKTLRNHNEVFRCNPRELSKLRKYLFSINHTLISGGETIRNALSLRQIEQEMADRLVRLLAECRHPIKNKPVRKRDLALKPAENYIFESDSSVVTIPELCNAANASKRTLEYAFLERYALTPKAYTLIYRLNNAHKQLRQAKLGTNQVSEIARQHGFWHMGQFSADYKKLFANHPSETLNRKV